ncbi:surface lipoprotein assembly modifier [Sphingomonas sp.]|uniref:surface lipoprotein assembly modifier n=1 Tax=Sphingomonas sp. TaxID=28214 RepID=UPI002E336B1D|nr:surface lipoprotein assembly modifier [Sphingomonas sp.]HEX4694428.1 surface lipoprotein assembly modifier [Sphingomonas sp.]
MIRAHQRLACTQIAIIGLALGVAPALAQERRTGLSATDLFALAERDVAADHPADALAIYTALARDPDLEVRSEARFREGMLLGALKRYAEAATVFRAFLDEKPGTPRVELELARVLIAMGDEAAARRALRQAQASGLPSDVAVVVDQFAAALRSTQRLGGSLEIALAPDSNVNRATSARTLDTVIAPLTLSRDARQQSGVGIKLSGQGYARLNLTQNLALLPRLSGAASLYRSPAFRDVSASALLGLEWRVGHDRLTPAAGPTWRWYGSQFYARTDTIALDWLHPLGRRSQLTVSGSAAHASYRLNPLQSGGLFDVSAGIEHAIDAKSGIGGGVGATRQAARDPGYSTIAGYANAFGWRDFGRVTIFGSASVRRTEGDARLAIFTDRRRETLYQMATGATIRSLTFHGFAPVVRLTYERNVSSVGLYDYHRLAADLGVTRAF